MPSCFLRIQNAKFYAEATTEKKVESFANLEGKIKIS